MRIDENQLPPGWDEGLEVERGPEGQIRRIASDRAGVSAVLEIGEAGAVFRETREYRWEPSEGAEVGLELMRRALMGGTGCAFCGRSPDEVGKLFAGATANICDACVELCVDIVDEDES